MNLIKDEFEEEEQEEEESILESQSEPVDEALQSEDLVRPVEETSLDSNLVEVQDEGEAREQPEIQPEEEENEQSEHFSTQPQEEFEQSEANQSDASSSIYSLKDEIVNEIKKVYGKRSLDKKLISDNWKIAQDNAVEMVLRQMNLAKENLKMMGMANNDIDTLLMKDFKLKMQRKIQYIEKQNILEQKRVFP